MFNPSCLSVSHTTQDLVFIWNMTDPLVVNPEIELPQLDISNNYTTDCTIEYSTGNFTCIQIVFNLRRRLGYHLFHTYIPSALIVVMSWIAFWIKPEAIPARVTLGVTSLLTLGKVIVPRYHILDDVSSPTFFHLRRSIDSEEPRKPLKDSVFFFGTADWNNFNKKLATGFTRAISLAINSPPKPFCTEFKIGYFSSSLFECSFYFPSYPSPVCVIYFLLRRR